jgi:hypothetical protein
MKKTNWCSKLEKEIWRAAAAQPEKPEPGYRSTQEWALVWNKSRPTANTIITRLMNLGKMESKKFTVLCGQVTRPIPHYRVR